MFSTDSDFTTYSNPNNKDDQVLSLLSSDGGLKLTLITIRNLMNDLSLAQNLSPLATRALGGSFSCAGMLANGMDANQVFQMTMNTDGPLRCEWWGMWLGCSRARATYKPVPNSVHIL